MAGAAVTERNRREDEAQLAAAEGCGAVGEMGGGHRRRRRQIRRVVFDAPGAEGRPIIGVDFSVAGKTAFCA